MINLIPKKTKASNSLNKLIAFIFIVFFGFMLLSVIWGILINYSPVPYMDDWDAIILSYLRIQMGEYSALWGQHNEHRLIFSKLFFWLDMRLFNGKMIIPLSSNIILSMGLVYCYKLVIGKLFSSENQYYFRIIITAFIGGIIFSWIQYENFSWGINMAFFAGFLFPFISFILLAFSKIKNSTFLLYLALFFGIISLGVMSNGLLALPLFVIMAFILKSGKLHVFISLSIAILLAFLYFNNYHFPTYHSSVIESLFHNPLDYFIYFVSYLGSPAYYLSGNTCSYCAPIMGLLVFSISVYFILKIFKPSSSQNPILLVLIIFLLYLEGTAFITSGGRLEFGLGQSLSSRYTTTSILIWSTIMILSYYNFQNQRIHQKWIIGLAILLAIFFASFQIKVSTTPINNPKQRKIACLALEIGVRDEQNIKSIYPVVDHVIKIANKARKENLSYFGNKEISNAQNYLNKSIGNMFSSVTVGKINHTNIVTTDTNFAFVSGWVEYKDQKKNPKSLFIINNENIIVGYAIIENPTVFSLQNWQSLSKLEFNGYILSTSINTQFHFVGRP